MDKTSEKAIITSFQIPWDSLWWKTTQSIGHSTRVVLDRERL